MSHGKWSLTNLLKLAKKEQDLSSLILFMLIFFIFFFFRIYLRSDYLEIDEAEQLVYAQHLSLGYPNQPPLYTWLQYLFFTIFGENIVALACLKSLLLTAAVYYYHQLCRFYCHSRALAWCATLAWVLIPSISLDLVKDNTHSILALVAACMTWHLFLAMSHADNIKNHVLLGIAMGIGLLSKFNYLLFLFPFIVNFYSANSSLKKKHLILSFFVALLLCLPYLIWLYSHEGGLQNAYKLSPSFKSHWQGLLELFKTILFFCAPVLSIIYLFFPLPSASDKLSFKKGSIHNTVLGKTNESSRFLVRQWLFSAISLILVVILGRLTDFETRWLIPIFFFVPLLIFNKIKMQNIRVKRVRQFMLFCLSIQLILFISLSYRAQSSQTNNQLLFNPLQELLINNKTKVTRVISDSHWLLGNIHLLSSTPLLLLNGPTPWQNNQGHLLLVWKSKEIPLWVSLLNTNSCLLTQGYLHDSKGAVQGGWYELLSKPCNQ